MYDHTSTSYCHLNILTEKKDDKQNEESATKMTKRFLMMRTLQATMSNMMVLPSYKMTMYVQIKTMWPYLTARYYWIVNS